MPPTELPKSANIRVDLGADNVLTTTQNRLVQLWAINVIT